MEVFNSLDSALQNEEFCEHLDKLDLDYCYRALSYSPGGRYQLYSELSSTGEDPFSNLKYIPHGMLADSNVGYKIDIPKNITSIHDFAFCNCFLLKEVNIGENVKVIGFGAFSNCNVLQTVNMPNKVGLNIGNNVFEDCVALREIILDKNVEGIGALAFNGCDLVIKFRGTEEEFLDIYKHPLWNPNQCPIEYEYKGN